MRKDDTIMLHNTWYKIKQDKNLTIGYFGGSITEGAGASDASRTSYRARVTAWFREQFPDAEIKEIQAAIGGTGSQLGMYRCENDLLSKEPDLVFLEYAVNDGGAPYKNICAQSETILRKLYAKNPFAEVIVIITTTASVCANLEKGGEFTSRSAHTAIAHHYHLPVIDIGNVLHDEVLRSGGDFLKFTTDSVHPNDAGYQIYTDVITAFLSDWLAKDADGEMAEVVLPAKTFCDKLHLDARMIDCAQLEAFETDGFTLCGNSLCGRYPRYIEGTKPGNSFSFTFTGENAGFYWMMAKDSGDVLISIDGGEEKSLRSWDTYCPRFNRANAAFFARNLEYGVHRVTVRIAETKAEESEGTAIRIGAVLVS